MASPKYRDFFITINEGASCYDSANDIVLDLNYKIYAIIKHDKDMLANDNGELTPKKTHLHIVIELKNPISFESMQKHFEGAHIETIKYKKAAYQYLIHNRPNAREKYQYDCNEIISNNLVAVKQAIEAEEGLRIFKENEFLLYICEGIITPYQFTKAFGLNVYKQYWKAYNDMVILSNTDEDMQRDIETLKKAMLEDLPF